MSSSLFLVVTFLAFVIILEAAPAKKESRDFYKILKISRSATEQEIKKAFKRLSVQLHPDKVSVLLRSARFIYL
jgi:preprotein translocase subunit Sec63